MRILLVDNFRPAVPREPSPLVSLAGLLAAAAGHQVELLAAADDAEDPAADPEHVPPATDPSVPLAAWDRWRALLDKQLLDFDPHVVHVVGLGAWGHLALEAGAVYILDLPREADVDPLDAARSSPVRRWHEQTIENATRIVVGSVRARDALVAEFGPLDGRIVLLDAARDALWWTALYQAAYRERYGHLADAE